MDILHAFTERCRGSFTEWRESADFLRLGLVSGTVAVMLALFAVPVFYAPGAGHDTTPHDIAAAAPQQLSRLPRPRPAEPVMTGSIRPADATAAAAPSAAQNTPAQSTAARNRRLDDLQTRAVLIAASWGECDQVENSELFELPGNGPDEIMVRIRCGNGTQFVLGETDIEANRIASRPPTLAPALNPAPEATHPTPTLAELAAGAIPTIGEPMPIPASSPLTDDEVVRVCEQKVAQGLPFPGSLNRALATTGIARTSGDAIVTFDFDALNGFGFPLFFRVQCVFDDRQLARLEVSPR